MEGKCAQNRAAEVKTLARIGHMGNTSECINLPNLFGDWNRVQRTSLSVRLSFIVSVIGCWASLALLVAQGHDFQEGGVLH